VPGRDEGTVSNADGRDATRRAKVDGKPCPPGMVKARCVDQQHLGRELQPRNRRCADRALPPSEQPRRVRSATGHHRLSNEVGSSTRQIVRSLQEPIH
jgi:hypothetical protein